MELQLQGKEALVTGSTQGIGKAIAQVLASEGAIVSINGRQPERVEQTIKELQAGHAQMKLVPAIADLSTPSGCEQIMKDQPALDILVNNLSIFQATDYFALTDEQWLAAFETNIMSGVRLTRYYLKHMLEKKQGRVIFIASEAAVMPSLEMIHYSATKAMQLSLSRSLAELTKGTQVTVNTVMPGSTKTEGVARLLQDLFPGIPIAEAEKRFMQENRPTSLIERLIRPEEIASFVAFLCSPLASAINGAALRIDGGLVRYIV